MAIICISRGTFSGGEAVAEAVAKRLGYPCVSREANLARAAEQFHIPPETLTATIEKPSLWDKMLGERDLYLACVRASLFEQAERGDLVYHGYLGQLLLPGLSSVLRVRVIADQEFRTRAAMSHQLLRYPEAEAYIARVDRERREWTRFLFGVNWEDPSLYDVVVNLNPMTVPQAVNVVLELANCPEFQSGNRENLLDHSLRIRVLAALAIDFRTRGAHLQVAAKAGVVTVTGTTHWQETLDAVPTIVRKVRGVVEVQSDITGIKPLHPLNFY